MRPLSRRERLLAAIRRQPVDRVPYALWRHFPAVDRSPAGLAQATLRFHERYGSDFLKITPTGGHAVAAWGCIEGEALAGDGHRPCVRRAVQDADDWARIRPLDPATAPGYADQLETVIRLGFDRRLGDAPVLITLFSPLSVAWQLSGTRLGVDLRERPDLVSAALDAITVTLVRFAELALAEGVSGVFYSIQTASRSLLGDEEYARFGEPSDRHVLESIAGRSMLTVIHGHGDRLLFDRLSALPGHAWSWDPRATPPSLGEGHGRIPGAALGGLDQWKTLRDGSPDQAVGEVGEAIAQTGGRGLIIGPGCVLPSGTPDATLAAVVKALGGPLTPLPGMILQP